ncbi:TPR domain protein, putative component of TonB system [Candidatus Nitrosotalea sp. TS]|nr:TPR domain protein, putative component of TonB system [Candidatus Nitrosotalea sp. TS]
MILAIIPRHDAFQISSHSRKRIFIHHEPLNQLLDKPIKVPDDAKSLHKDGLEFQQFGRHEEAISCFDKALEIEPHNAEFLYDKAISLQTMLRFEDAIKYYDAVLKIESDSFASLINKGLCLSTPSINRQEEALLCFEEALGIDPDDLGALSLKGYSLDSLGRYREAIGCFDKVLEQQPNELNISVNKGLALLHLGKYDEAIAYFDKVLEYEPDNLFASEWKKDAEKMREKDLFS